jgi:hypothetical protein
MSYGIQSQCGSCNKFASGCKDLDKIQEAVTKIHQDTETHKGAGTVILQCFRQDSTCK